MSDQSPPLPGSGRQLPPPPPPKPTDWSTPRPEIPKTTMHPVRKVLIVVAVVVLIAALAVIFMLTSKKNEPSTNAVPDQSTVPVAPTVTLDESTSTSTSTSISSTTVAAPTTTSTSQVEPTSLESWLNDTGRTDVEAVMAAVDQIVNRTDQDPNGLIDLCGNVIETTVVVRSHPAISDADLDAAWQEALNRYEGAANVCREAVEANDPVRQQESMDVFVDESILAAIRPLLEGQATVDE